MVPVATALLADDRRACVVERLTFGGGPILRYVGLVTLSTWESVHAGGSTRDVNDLAVLINATTIGAKHISPTAMASSPTEARQVEDVQADAAHKPMSLALPAERLPTRQLLLGDIFPPTSTAESKSAKGALAPATRVGLQIAHMESE